MSTAEVVREDMGEKNAGFCAISWCETSFLLFSAHPRRPLKPLGLPNKRPFRATVGDILFASSQFLSQQPAPGNGTMFSEEELSQYYNQLAKVYEKALEDVLWQLRQLSEKKGGDYAKILNSSIRKQRVKQPDSILKKCRRDRIENLDEINDRIEDILGIRIVTVNKEHARELFDLLRSSYDTEKAWFCDIIQPPKFVPYTIQDKNTYSLKTGYQAYHITFIYTRTYGPFHKIAKWPVEIQIMSQLWDFWAEYSRKYFYGGTGVSSQLLPYNVTISKILDSADELMVTTTQILTQAVPETQTPPQGPSEEDTSITTAGVSTAEVSNWFDKNLQKHFGTIAKKPIELFLAKIAEELNLYGIDLDGLERILGNKEIRARYQAILRDSNVGFLPPYQQILFFVLLSRGLKPHRVVERVNNELRLLGITLWAPPE